jgi:adenylate kinase
MAGRSPIVVIEIALRKEEVLRRLAARMVCDECGANAQDDREFSTCHDCGGPLVPRVDDGEVVVLNRLDVYTRQTEPLIDFYRKRPTFRQVDGAQLVDRVTADIMHAVKVAGATVQEPPVADQPWERA